MMDEYFERGITNRGNLYRLHKVLKKAQSGQKLTIGFLGGSITQGCASSSPENCYAYRVFLWWKNTFKNSDFVYINAGIGGTTSQLGVARVQEDLLYHKPDFVITEFSVNDTSDEHFYETYEGLIRRIYSFESKPAILIVHNVFYNSGANAQLFHGKIGRFYQIPCVSMRSTIFEQILTGKLENREITADDLHPNDLGHQMIAEVICYFLDKVNSMPSCEDECLDELPAPQTLNRYENSMRYNNKTISPVLNGFIADDTVCEGVSDCFKNGWYGKQIGESIEFELEGSYIAIAYREYANRPGPIATVTIDDEIEYEIDSSFDENWGDNLKVLTLAENLETKTHSLKLSYKSDNSSDEPFYLVSVISNSR